MTDILVLGTMIALFLILGIVALAWGVDSREDFSDIHTSLS